MRRVRPAPIVLGDLRKIKMQCFAVSFHFQQLTGDRGTNAEAERRARASSSAAGPVRLRTPSGETGHTIRFPTCEIPQAASF
jgi:hypothetical protein